MISEYSIDGKSRALDNVMIERLWRTVKYGDIFIRAYAKQRTAPTKPQQLNQIASRGSTTSTSTTITQVGLA